MQIWVFSGSVLSANQQFGNSYDGKVARYTHQKPLHVISWSSQLLKTHRTPEKAHTVLTFLDELHDVICQNYGNDIVKRARQNYTTSRAEEEEVAREDNAISL